MTVVLSGCTKYIQAPGVCWNAPFKGLVTEMYDAWMAEGSQEFTTQGNMKAPPRRVIVEWILEAWNSLSKDVIKSSFKSCGLNISVDGSGDHLIHCFKDDQTCSMGAERLQVIMASTIEDDRENPLSLLEDSDVEEAALVVDSDDETDDLSDI